MNIFKAALDTRHQNCVIGTVTQFDNAVLELQVVTDGVIDEAWDNPRFELIAMKRDANEVREVDQDRFTILSKEEHRVQIELKEQFLTCRGTVKMQLIVKDGSRESTTLFYLVIAQSLDHDIVESHRDVKVLDDLEAYIQTGREVIYEAQEIVIGLKGDMSEFNTMSSEKEADRQASELNRASKELIRIDNEEDRVANEQVRVANEEERVQNEQDRVTNETARRLAETTRIAQERARQDAELQRNAIFEENENLRKDGEKTRIANENERKKKFESWEGRETTRLKSEENRIIQEKERVINEEERQRQEQTRQNQEDYRQRTYTQFNEAEASRVNKELQRQSAEEKRVAAEANRQSNYVESENERDRQYAEAEEIRNNAFEQNEANRQAGYTEAERDRVESEELRKARERDRESAETNRVNAETERVNAEQGRVNRFNSEIEKAKNTMNEAVADVNAAIATADSTMQGIEVRAEACLPIIEDSATAKVDYMGNEHKSIKAARDADVDWILGEVNTAHYEGQHITALDALEGRAKSAILSGQTLVNLFQGHGFLVDHNNIYTSYNNGIYTYQAKETFEGNIAPANMLGMRLHYKPIIGKTYTVFVTQVAGGNSRLAFVLRQQDGVSAQIYEERSATNGLHKFTFTHNYEGEYNSIELRLTSYTNERSIQFKDIMLIEGDYTNVDISYFTGMTSCKMPVLKATGKNLFDISSMSNISNWDTDVSSTNPYCSYKINLKPNTTYTFKQKQFLNIENAYASFGLNKGGYEYSLAIAHPSEQNKTTFTFATDDRGFIYLKLYKADVVLETFISKLSNNQLQLEEGTQATSYEPFKSNILMVNEPIELRGIGDVKDKLNLLTGEVVERIREITLNGSEHWEFHDQNNPNTIAFRTPVIGNVANNPAICDKFANVANNSDTEHCFVGASNFVLYINRNRLSSNTSSGLKEYLQQNPTTVQYQLATESVKTVDLNGQKVYSYDGTTHYSCSATEGALVPTLSIDVPTNLPALVSRQRATIESQKEQIITLEQENEQLIAQNEVQDIDISLNQDAINFMLFAPATMSLNDESRNNEGVNTMAAYLANQILKGKLDYTLVVSRYGSYKEDIDTILIAEGKQDLIK